MRELENLIERLVATCEDRRIRVEDLPLLAGVRPGQAWPEGAPAGDEGWSSPVAVRRVVPLAEALEALELELVGAAYEQYGSSVKVGEALGIHQTTAARKIRDWKAARGRAPE